MVTGGALAWLDFQDALLGPRIYDMVALLQDSYQTFDAEFVDDRLADYADAAGLGAADRDALRLEFDLVTIQRKLKDAGRFVFIERVKGNPSFLPLRRPVAPQGEGRARSRRPATTADLAEPRALLHRVLPEVLLAHASTSPPARAEPRSSGRASASIPRGLDLGDGQILPLYAGAMHYWRHTPADWGAGARRARSLGPPARGHRTSPGAVHEIEPGPLRLRRDEPEPRRRALPRDGAARGLRWSSAPGRTSTPS